MSDNKFATPESDLGNVQLNNMQYAGFWIRAAASIIDTIWQLVLLGGLGWVLFGEAIMAEDPFTGGPAMLLFQYVLPAIIIIGFWTYYSATPGKMLFGLKVVRASDGSNIGIGRGIGRYLGYMLSTIVLFLGFIWIGFDKRKQGWHDKLAGTVVVKTK